MITFVLSKYSDDFLAKLSWLDVAYSIIGCKEFMHDVKLTLYPILVLLGCSVPMVTGLVIGWPIP